MAPVSRTGGGQIRTGPTGKLPEIVRRTGVYFRPCTYSYYLNTCYLRLNTPTYPNIAILDVLCEVHLKRVVCRYKQEGDISSIFKRIPVYLLSNITICSRNITRKLNCL